MATPVLIVLLAITALLTPGWATQQPATFFVTSPNVFRVGVPEKVLVTLIRIRANIPNVPVRLSVRQPDSRPFFETSRSIRPGLPESFNVTIEAEHLARNEGTLQHMVLKAESLNSAYPFEHETEVLVTLQSGYVFIQTNKPIYTPNQPVRIRVLSLDHNMLPSNQTLHVKIINPRGISVERLPATTAVHGLLSGEYRFHDHPPFGNWSVTAFYGHEFLVKSSVSFELKEYGPTGATATFPSPTSASFSRLDALDMAANSSLEAGLVRSTLTQAQGYWGSIPQQRFGFREILVQYIPGKPYALTEFGAFLDSHHDRHEFRAIDGTGLAKAAGLRDGDVLLSINNLQVGLQIAHQLAVLECFSDIGTSLGLVVERRSMESTETWLIAFHLNENGNRPIVENLFSQRIDSESPNVTFPYFIGNIPVESAFEVNPVYQYVNSQQVQIILQNGDRFMEIDTDKATYVIPTQTLTLHRYSRIDVSSTKGIPVAISTPSASNPSMCIEAVGSGPLNVVAFPSYMTQQGSSILQNNMFFIMSVYPDNSAVIKAANTQQELYISSDIQSPNFWIASLGTPPSTFKIEYLNSSALSEADAKTKKVTGESESETESPESEYGSEYRHPNSASWSSLSSESP